MRLVRHEVQSSSLTDKPTPHFLLHHLDLKYELLLTRFLGGSTGHQARDCPTKGPAKW